MQKVANYAYLHTLTTILSDQLFNTSEFSRLLKLSLEEIVKNLDNCGLSSILIKLKQSNYQLLPAGNMDNLFLSVLLNESRSIIRSLTGTERDFFTYWMRRFELQNIKTILRGKSLECSPEQIQQELTDLGDSAVLPVEELLNSDEIPEILNQLQNTPFSAIARYSRENFEQKQDVFTVETSINYQYFNGLDKRKKLLDKQERDLLQPVLGRIIDQINLVWILRYRLNYKLSASHTYFLLAPGGLYLNSTKLIQLSQIEKFEQLSTQLPENLQQFVQEGWSIHQIELCMEQKILEVTFSLLKATQFSIVKAFAYLIIREKQLAQIHALLKGKLLNLTDEEIVFAMGEVL